MPERIVIFLFVQLLVCLYALWRGGAPERWMAWMMAAGVALTPTLAWILKITFAHLSPPLVALDLLLLVGFLLLAIRADRFWPMWIAALQLIVIGIHISRGLDPQMLPSVYNRTIGKIAYPMMVLLVVGTFRHHRRKQRGNDADWSPVRW